MSFVTSIRDYIEVINNSYDAVSDKNSIINYIQIIGIFFLESTKNTIFYLLTFQWFKDLSYLPVIVPQITESIIKEQFFIENPIWNFFTFLEIPTYSNNKILVGFLNSFFLCLPFSCASLITIRRLVIQGIPAGISSAAGSIVGQLFLIFCTISGFRFLIIPLHIFEPFNYLFGVILVFYIIYEMVEEKEFSLIQITEGRKLINIFLLNLGLSWTEQSCIFPYLTNLNFDAEPTIIENFSTINQIHNLFLHTSYFFGLFCGAIFWSFAYGFFILKIKGIPSAFFKIKYSTFVNRFNTFLLITIIGFACTSIPYYSIDYLLLNPFGFISQDKIFNNTILSNTILKHPWDNFTRDPRQFDIDTTPFDKGQYSEATPFEKNFEELNFEGEYAWTKGKNYSSSMSKNTEQTEFIKKILSSLFGTAKENTRLNKKEKQVNQTSESTEKNILEIKNHESYPFNRSNRESLTIQNKFQNLISLTFSPDFFYEQTDHARLNKTKIQKQYYSNPIYKTLLNMDIDLFINNEPNSQTLTKNEEEDLFKKRMKLAMYYDNLRYYQKLTNSPQKKDLKEYTYESKSYADRVFNHQFKGTLKVVRRLFSITLNPQENITKNRVLKFDKPLYTNKKSDENLNAHEELELSKITKSPFIEMSHPVPLYAGWDEELRKLILTNRLMPRYFASFEFKKPEIQHNGSNLLDPAFASEKKIEFTAWPLSKNIIFDKKQLDTLPHTLFFNNKTSYPEEKDNHLFIEKDQLFGYAQRRSWDYKSLPYSPENYFKESPIIPPNKGGFIWPGNSFLQYKFSKIQ